LMARSHAKKADWRVPGWS